MQINSFTCVCKALNGGAHRRLQLINWGRLAVPRVHGLLITDEREGQGPSAGRQCRFELGEMDPQVVGVEEPVWCAQSCG